MTMTHDPASEKQCYARPHRHTAYLGTLCAILLLTILICLGGNRPQLALAEAFSAEEQIDGATVYVAPNGNDNNPGTQAQPFRTIQHAVDGANAGTTIYVRQGQYHEVVQMNQSGTAAQPITLAAYPGEHPVIDGEYTLPDSPPVRWNNTIQPPRFFHYDALVRIKGSNIVVRGFELKRSLGRGFTVGGKDNSTRSTNVIIEDCSVHDVRNSQMQIQYVNNVVVQRCDLFHGSDYATHDRATSELNWPSMLMASDVDHAIFRQNTVHENWGEGVSANEDATHITIADNTIYDNLGQQLYIHRSQYVTVERNFIYHSNNANFRRGGDPSGCIALNNEKDFADSLTVEHVEIRHNVVVGCRRNMALWTSDQTHLPIRHVHIANNTFVNAFSNTARGAVNLSINANNLEDIVIENNVLMQTTKTDQQIGAATNLPAITYRKNLWSVAPPNHMKSSSDLFVDPGLANPDGALSPGNTQLLWYKPRANSPALSNNLGASEIFNNNGNVTPTPTPSGGAPTPTPSGDAPTPTPAPTNIPTTCKPSSTTALANGSFEEDIKQWYFRTNGKANVSRDRAAYDCSWTARVQIDRAKSTTKFYQKQITLEPNTLYRLSFAAYSSSGHDLVVDLQKNGGARTNYGVKRMRADLQQGWRIFYIEFTTRGFSKTVKNAKLQFSLSPYSSNGDIYWLDHVVLKQINSAESKVLPDERVEQNPLVPVDEPPASTSVIQGFVALVNADGSQQIPAVDSTIATLVDTGTNGEIYEDWVESDEDGFYRFEEMPVGEYQLSFSPPTGYLAPTPRVVQVQAEGQQEFSDQLTYATEALYLPLIQN